MPGALSQRQQSMRDICLIELTFRNRRTKDICVIAIIIAELELGNIQRHVFLADLVEAPDDPALENRPEAFKIVFVWIAPTTYSFAP